MPVEDALFTRLSGFSNLTALVPAARIIPTKVEGPTPTLPYLTWQLVSTVENHHTFSFETDFERTEQFRFHAWAETTTAGGAGHDQCRNIIKQVRLALHGYQDAEFFSFVDDEYVVAEDAESIHHRILDVMITSSADNS